MVKSDVFRFIETCNETFDFIFAGPPYALTTIDELPVKVFQKPILNEKGWFVLEHTPRNEYSAFPFFKMARNYGTTVFSFFVNQTDSYQ
jgi:16S rRNA G966 N2-methylase RsmD